MSNPTWDQAPVSPFGQVDTRIPLTDSPIVRVLTQVRFSPILRVEETSFVANVQDALRADYPLTSKEHQQQVMSRQGGQLEVGDAEVLWRFRDATEHWQVTLGTSFIAIETTSYESREDYLSRLSKVLAVAEKHLKPGLVLRVGTRYLDRLSGSDFADLKEHVRKPLLGVQSADLGNDGKLLSLLTQAEFEIDNLRLLGRWGYMPPSASHDPTVAPLDESSWILDLDVYSTPKALFDAGDCVELATQQVATSYNFFRWIVSDQFLEKHKQS